MRAVTRSSEPLPLSSRSLYDADLVTTEYWEPALEALGRPREVAPLMLNGKGKSRQVRRAEAREKAKS